MPLEKYSSKRKALKMRKTCSHIALYIYMKSIQCGKPLNHVKQSLFFWYFRRIIISKLKEVPQLQSTLQAIQDISMKGKPQAVDAMQKATALRIAEKKNAHPPFKPALLPF